MLIEKGANIEHENKNRGTALIWAASYGESDNNKKTFKSNDIFSKLFCFVLFSFFFHLFFQGHILVVKLLIENGANVNHSDKSGDSPIIWAASHGESVTKISIAAYKLKLKIWFNIHFVQGIRTS